MVYGRGWRHAPIREYIDPENPSLIAALPPCFLVTARGDFLRHYSRDFAAALKKNGKRSLWVWNRCRKRSTIKGQTITAR